MDIATAALLAEIIGAICVVGSLVFLGIETRKNTRMMRASLSNDVLTATAELNDVVLADTELRRVASKAFDPTHDAEDFTADEKDLVIFLARALFFRYEGVYMLYRQGLVEPSLWAARRRIASGLISIPIWNQYWENEQKMPIFSEEFVAEVNAESGTAIPPPISANGT